MVGGENSITLIFPATFLNLMQFEKFEKLDPFSNLQRVWEKILFLSLRKLPIEIFSFLFLEKIP